MARRADKTESGPIIRLPLCEPGTDRRLGSLHPVTLVRLHLEERLRGLGFEVLDSPEVEPAGLAFDALQVASDHPAREAGHLFQVGRGAVLRGSLALAGVRAIE